MTLAPNWKNCPNCAAKDAEIERLEREVGRLTGILEGYVRRYAQPGSLADENERLRAVAKEALTRALNNLRYEFAIARHAWSAQERSDEAQPKEER